jgi:hypothetical protein
LRHDAIEVVNEEGGERGVALAGGFALIDRQRAFGGGKTSFSLGGGLADQLKQPQAEDPLVEPQRSLQIRHRHNGLDSRSDKHRDGPYVSLFRLRKCPRCRFEGDPKRARSRRRLLQLDTRSPACSRQAEAASEI